MPDQITNNLSGQKSPYLLQHASNPVYWYPWGNQALTKAREEDKLIVISIGYAACHWCHVMEKESFSDDAVARRMNENFISIKVDREELIEALKRVSLLVEQKSRRIYINLKEQSMILSSEESEIGIAKEEIPCDYSGEDTIFALNYLYFVEPLRVMSDPQIMIQFTEANKAITLLSTEEREYFHIVMPMQLE